MASGVVNFGLGHNSLDHPWKALYYFGGAVTIAWAIPIYFLMPSSPLNPGRFFDEREKVLLRKRFEENPYGRDRQPFVMAQFIEAMVDWKTWLYLLMATAIYVRPPCCAYADWANVRSATVQSQHSARASSTALAIPHFKLPHCSFPAVQSLASPFTSLPGLLPSTPTRGLPCSPCRASP